MHLQNSIKILHNWVVNK